MGHCLLQVTLNSKAQVRSDKLCLRTFRFCHRGSGVATWGGEGEGYNPSLRLK